MSIPRACLSLLVAVLATACDNFEYHPYAADISGRTDIHASSVAEIERRAAGSDTVRFAFITDTQGAYDELRDAVRYLRGRHDVMFLIHGGDQSDFGLTREFLWTRDILDTAALPYLCLLGNHDCLGTGEHTFTTLYGAADFTLNAAFLHIVAVNTVALEYDYSHPVPDFGFMESDIKSVATLGDSLRCTLVVMHAPPHNEQFNNNVANVFEHYISQYPGLGESDERYAADYPDTLLAATHRRGLCLNGHCHRTETLNIFGDGRLYWGLANAAEREMMIITVTREGYDCKTIHF